MDKIQLKHSPKLLHDSTASPKTDASIVPTLTSIQSTLNTSATQSTCSSTHGTCDSTMPLDGSTSGNEVTARLSSSSSKHHNFQHYNHHQLQPPHHTSHYSPQIPHSQAALMTIRDQDFAENERELYWVLSRANLLQYFASFLAKGGDQVSQLDDAAQPGNEEEFHEILELVGMTDKTLHIRRLQKSLAEWRSCSRSGGAAWDAYKRTIPADHSLPESAKRYLKSFEDRMTSAFIENSASIFSQYFNNNKNLLASSSSILPSNCQLKFPEFSSSSSQSSNFQNEKLTTLCHQPVISKHSFDHVSPRNAHFIKYDSTPPSYSLHSTSIASSFSEKICSSSSSIANITTSSVDEENNMRTLPAVFPVHPQASQSYSENVVLSPSSTTAPATSVASSLNDNTLLRCDESCVSACASVSPASPTQPVNLAEFYQNAMKLKAPSPGTKGLDSSKCGSASGDAGLTKNFEVDNGIRVYKKISKLMESKSGIPVDQLPNASLSTFERLRISIAAQNLALALPKFETREATTGRKEVRKETQHILNMALDDPRRIELIYKYSAIYGRFNAPRRTGKPMNQHEVSVNEAAAQICMLLPDLITRRDTLFHMARQVVKMAENMMPKTTSTISSTSTTLSASLASLSGALASSANATANGSVVEGLAAGLGAILNNLNCGKPIEDTEFSASFSSAVASSLSLVCTSSSQSLLTVNNFPVGVSGVSGALTTTSSVTTATSHRAPIVLMMTTGGGDANQGATIDSNGKVIRPTRKYTRYFNPETGKRVTYKERMKMLEEGYVDPVCETAIPPPEGASCSTERDKKALVHLEEQISKLKEDIEQTLNKEQELRKEYTEAKELGNTSEAPNLHAQLGKIAIELNKKISRQTTLAFERMNLNHKINPTPNISMALMNESENDQTTETIQMNEDEPKNKSQKIDEDQTSNISFSTDTDINNYESKEERYENIFFQNFNDLDLYDLNQN